MFKKVLAVGFSAVLALSLVACGGSKDNKSKSSKETTTASESEAATVYSVKDEKIKVDSGVIKLADYSQLTVYEDDVKVTDDSYKSQVDYILEQSATYKDTKLKLTTQDRLSIRVRKLLLKAVQLLIRKLTLEIIVADTLMDLLKH